MNFVRTLDNENTKKKSSAWDNETNSNDNFNSIEYVWYETSGQLSIENLDFITSYQNFLVIDGSKDYDKLNNNILSL